MLLRFRAVTYIITGIRISIKILCHVQLSLPTSTAKFAKISNNPSKTYNSISLVEILPLVIVATAGLEIPSSKTVKICKLLVSDNKLQQRLNTEFIHLGYCI